jgi:DNA-binding SARP family transcriptional activator
MDVDEFKAHLHKAEALEEAKETALAMSEYQAAEILYQGEFLEEDRYEDWIFPLRQSLQNDYLSLLERLSTYYYEHNQYDACANICNKEISTDPCREEAHFRLMQCYRQQGFPYLAIRQYHRCVDKLKSELDVPPSPRTTALMDEIRRG